MIKVESNMLILDATLSKQDAAAINEFIDIAKKEEQDRIISIVKSLPHYTVNNRFYIEPRDLLMALSKEGFK